jgi:hypothetical protein
MEEPLYDNELIIDRLAHLKIKNFATHVRAGDFKILIDQEHPKGPRRIIRWPNTNILGPDWRAINGILGTLFHARETKIRFQAVYPCGVEIILLD